MLGFTDVLVFDYTELTTAGTTQTISHTLPICLLDTGVIVRVGQAFVRPAGAVSVDVGHNGLSAESGTISSDADYFIDARSLAVQGTIWGTDDATAGALGSVFINEGGTTKSRLDFLFTSSSGDLGDGTNPLSGATAGRMEFYFKALMESDFSLRQG
jgi:hypothetical protein